MKKCVHTQLNGPGPEKILAIGPCTC